MSDADPTYQAQGFADIADPSQPNVRTLDQSVLKIGDQLEQIVRPVVPDGVLTLTAEQKKAMDAQTTQISWLIMGLLVSFLIKQFFAKRGHK